MNWKTTIAHAQELIESMRSMHHEMTSVQIVSRQMNVLRAEVSPGQAALLEESGDKCPKILRAHVTSFGPVFEVENGKRKEQK